MKEKTALGKCSQGMRLSRNDLLPKRSESRTPGAGLNNFANMLQAKCISKSRGPTIIENDISQSRIGSMNQDPEPYESLTMVRRTCAPHARCPFIRLSARHRARLPPFHKPLKDAPETLSLRP